METKLIIEILDDMIAENQAFLDRMKDLKYNVSHKIPVKNLDEPMSECHTCGEIQKPNITPDGDNICRSCGDTEMLDYEDDIVDEQSANDITN